MGLDNGLIIKPKTERGKYYLEAYFHNLRNEYAEKDEYEFGYWRKCWNIRQKFIDDFVYDEEEQEIRFELDDIPAIIETLEYFLNKDNWKMGNVFNAGSTIFNWYEEIASIANAIRDLYIFYDNIDNDVDNEDDVCDEDFEIYFYDSY